MKRKLTVFAMTSLVALSSLLVGCDQTISREEKAEVNRDGSVERETETVTRNADGTVTKSEESTKTAPANP